jgi:hypothetical protein
VQLQRDTTVQSLTISPSLDAGVVVWKVYYLYFSSSVGVQLCS